MQSKCALIFTIWPVDLVDKSLSNSKLWDSVSSFSEPDTLTLLLENIYWLRLRGIARRMLHYKLDIGYLIGGVYNIPRFLVLFKTFCVMLVLSTASLKFVERRRCSSITLMLGVIVQMLTMWV